MTRGFANWLVGGAILLVAASGRAEDRNSLGYADIVGTITATQKIKPDIERSPVIGYVTVGQTTVAVGVGTRISDGPGDLVERGFDSLQRGRKVEVVLGRSGTTLIASQINLLPDPPADK